MKQKIVSCTLTAKQYKNCFPDDNLLGGGELLGMLQRDLVLKCWFYSFEVLIQKYPANCFHLRKNAFAEFK